MEYKSGDKFRYQGKNYIVFSAYRGLCTVVDLDSGTSGQVKVDGTEERLALTYTLDNTILLSDVKIGEKFKYGEYTYVKIDPIKVRESDCRLYTSKCIQTKHKYDESDIGRGFCIPLDRTVERVKD